ncbi:MAG: hypothetical protein ACI4NP_03950 [Thermoguttaceae bacterium]
MQIKNIFLILAAAGACVATSGCGQKLPEGIPDLVPVTLVLTQEGAPLDEATVSCVPVDTANSRWSCGGTTDAKGELPLTTLGQYKGVPEGEYKVVVMKMLIENPPQTRDDPPGQRYRLVPEEYESADATPLTFTASKDQKRVELDLGPAIKEEMKSRGAL